MNPIRAFLGIVAAGLLVALNLMMWWYWLPFELTRWYHENSPGRFW